jgi:hypothetical protein
MERMERMMLCEKVNMDMEAETGDTSRLWRRRWKDYH